MKLAATLEPEQLGHGTTVGFAFEITSNTKLVPPALVDAELLYPGNLGFAVSGLGLATCAPAKLAAHGPPACPVNSRMGFGSAVAELKAEGLIISEAVSVTIVRGPTREGHLALLFYANGSKPVSAQIVFPGLLVPAGAPFGGAVSFDVPLVPSWPEGPDLSIVKLYSTLGPKHLTYYEKVKGKSVPYNPQGILLPKVCPRGGFRFAGVFHFIDGSRSVAKTAVPCPS
ncbi:MAG TPA: hypothetical protein VGI52_09420 [Solirubrobacteraceae bacterium]